MVLVDITIPVLNEEETLQQNVIKVLDFIKSSLSDNYDVHIVIVDNGSSDRTQEIGLELERSFPKVRYIRLDKRGVGLALRSSWLSSKADIVGYMDLDLATELRHLNQAFHMLEEEHFDIVTGTRLAKDSQVVGRSLLRGVTTRVFNKILKIYLGSSFSDGMCGFKFLKRSLVDDLVKLGAKSDGWFFATELLVCADHAGLKIADLPVTWHDDPNSKVKVGKLAFEYLLAMRELKKTLKENPKGKTS